MNDFKGFIIAMSGLAMLIYGLYGFANSGKFSWNKNILSNVQTEARK